MVASFMGGSEKNITDQGSWDKLVGGETGAALTSAADAANVSLEKLNEALKDSGGMSCEANGNRLKSIVGDAKEGEGESENSRGIRICGG